MVFSDFTVRQVRPAAAACTITDGDEPAPCVSLAGASRGISVTTGSTSRSACRSASTRRSASGRPAPCETRPGRCLRRAFTRVWRASVNRRVIYDPPAIGHWLLVFLSRFFGCSPFKRLAMLNGQKVVTGDVAAWRLGAPSDGNALLRQEELEHNGPSA